VHNTAPETAASHRERMSKALPDYILDIQPGREFWWLPGERLMMGRE